MLGGWYELRPAFASVLEEVPWRITVVAASISAAMRHKAGSLDLKPGALKLKPGSLNLMSGSLNLKPGSLKLKPGSLNLKPGSLKLKPGSLKLKPGSLKLKPGCLKPKPGTLKLRYIAPSHSPLFMSSCVSLANIASAQIAACVTHAFCYSSSKQSAVHK